MEQNKFFYNICNDLWAFSKKLTKDKSNMTDDDWNKAIASMENISAKYKTLGEKEYELMSKITLEILNYIESK